MKPFNRRSLAALSSLALLVTAISSQVVRAESQQDILVFLSAQGYETFSASDPALEGFDPGATADVLYTFNSDRFRFLAEYIWSDEENELERLQAAWQVDDKTMMWFGRFHAITNFWTTEYHHGQYMQTSISRPGLEEWEDESGPMPSHITGGWIEHEFSVQNQSALNLGLTAGIAPTFEGQQLVPYDVLDPTSGHDLAVSGRITYRPDVLSANQVGLTISHNDIAVVSNSSPNLADLNQIEQVTIGLFASWHWKDWRLVSNGVYFDIDMHYVTGTVKDDFFLGYVQAEYEAAKDWTVFGRIELGAGEDDSIYLQLLPAVIAHRHMLGLRWDIADSHALTMEIADTSTPVAGVGHDNFKEFRFQWSAVFP
jgi:hypothetical protein